VSRISGQYLSVIHPHRRVVCYGIEKIVSKSLDYRHISGCQLYTLFANFLLFSLFLPKCQKSK